MRNLPQRCIIPALMVLGLVLLPHGYAEEDCASCGEPVLDAVSESRLAGAGFPLDEFRLLTAWEETANDGALVYGFRIAPREGGAPFDAYLDASGALLGLEDLARIGVLAKTWDAPPFYWPAEVQPGLPLLREERPAPAPVREWAPQAHVTLPPLDLEPVRREDAAAEAAAPKAPVRFGVFRDLPVPSRAQVGEDAWAALPSGESICSRVIASPGAIGMRVHIARFDAPDSALVYLFNPDAQDECYGPFDPCNDFWTPTCFSDRAVVPCVLPPGANPADTSLEIDRIIHIYKGFGELPWSKAAGACNLDVACYGDWANIALGVGGLGTIGNAGYLWCTGSLVADGDPATQTPFLMTAHHCVGSPSGANSLEVYWLYQRPVCGGSAPDPKTVPRTTGGADYLISSSSETGTDFSLLRLRNAPPAGLIYLGLTSEAPSLGTGVTCVHHPSGDYKRISFGALSDSGSPSLGGAPMQPRTRFHEVLWNEGTTEPGSSGSPLLLTEAQVFIGQLWGGGASCWHPEEPDYFGRFDVTFPLVSDRLGPVVSPYDVDGSGAVNASDLQVVINVLLGEATSAAADVDRSGGADARDLQLVVQAILSGR